MLVRGGFDTAVEWTNREAFCIGCHEMYDNVYVEYQDTIHYNNRTGVPATCADCHVPRAWRPKMVRKVQASREPWGKLTGTIDTREKFEEKRLTLARREWKRMLANDSLECRNCHGLKSMDVERQATRSARQHERARDEGITCIVCHQGIAHQLSEDMQDEDYLDTMLPVAGASHLEGITGDIRIGRNRHGGGWAYQNGESCYACHFDETQRMGDRIVGGAKLEPSPIAGKVPSIPFTMCRWVTRWVSMPRG